MFYVLLVWAWIFAQVQKVVPNQTVAAYISAFLFGVCVLAPIIYVIKVVIVHYANKFKKWAKS